MGAPYRYLHSAVYRFKDAIKGTGIYRQSAHLTREQFLSSHAIESLQVKRLKLLLSRAAKHSNYYGKLFKKKGLDINEICSLSQLHDLPLLRREDLQDNYRAILCDDAENPIPNSSGGSTGNPVNFYQDDYYVSYSNAANLLFLKWMGIHSGDRTAVFWGSDREIRDMSARDRLWMKFDRVRLLNSFSMTDEAVSKFIEDLNSLKPRYIHGYAGSLYYIAGVINNSRPLDFAPRAIRSSAETLYDFQREEIERAFQARVFNFYGSREVNNLAAECPAHEGLHIFSSGRIVELVDDNGEPVPDGIAGQVAVTDLTNLSFPFIRYLNGDMAVKSGRLCSCGRGYPLLDKIEGRTTDMIVINGQTIHGEYFTHLFYGKPEIKQFQVIQEDMATLRILVVFRDRRGNIDDILSKIRSKVGDRVKIILERVDHIPVTTTGKYRFTISKISRATSGKPSG